MILDTTSIRNRQFRFADILPVLFLTWQLFLLAFLFFSTKGKGPVSSISPVGFSESIGFETDHSNSRGGVWLENSAHAYLPVIFIGGPMRSGTTLTAALLDALPSVSCGRESVLIPKILDWLFAQYMSNGSGAAASAGVTMSAIDNAVRSFITSVLFSGTAQDAVDDPDFRPCKKDPYTMVYAYYLSKLYPKTKFVLLIRDGRDVAQSRVTHNFMIDWGSYNNALKLWNDELSLMIKACKDVGPDRCYPLFYEQLVLNTEPNLKSLLDFLGLPWHENILHHDTVVAKKYNSNDTSDGWVDTVSHAIHKAPLGRWIAYLQENPGESIDLSVAPLITSLGYGMVEKVEDYGRTKQVQLDSNSLIYKNRLFWRGSKEPPLPNSAAIS